MTSAAARGRAYDLAPLPAAGRLVATGQATHLYAQHPDFYNLVDDPVFRRASADSGFAYEPTPFVYPPLVAWFMGALHGVPFAAQARMWALLSTAFVLAGLYLVIATYLPEWRRPPVLALLLLALCAFEPLRYGFWLGQTTAIIFPLVLGGIALQRADRPALAGSLLAAAAFVKLTPAAIAVVWLWRGPRRAAAWFGVVLAALWMVSVAALGLDAHRDYLDRLWSISRTTIVAFNNHSLTAFLSRFSFEPSDWLAWEMHPPQPAATFLSVALLSLAAGAAWAGLRRIPGASADEWRPCAEGMAMLIMLLAPNIAWTHYFVFLLPVMAVVIGRSRGESLLALALTGGAFALCSWPLVVAQDAVPVGVGSALELSGPTIAAAALTVALLQTIGALPGRAIPGGS
jgi:hypothetical protein